MKCPRCNSTNIRGGKADMPQGTLHEYRCLDCELAEDKLDTAADYHDWVARWSDPATKGMSMEQMLAADDAPWLKKGGAKPASSPSPVVGAARVARDATEAALLQAVLDDPDAQQARIDYADWLDGQGDARGELIRLQLRVDELRKQRASTRTVDAKIKTLLEGNRSEWLEALAPLIDAGVVKEPGFYRGFVERVVMTADDFVDRFDEVIAVAPIRFLQLSGAGSRAAEVFASPHLARIRALDLRWNDLSDADIEKLAASSHAGGLRWLNLSFNEGLTQRALEHIAQSSHLKQLQFLGFDGNGAEDPKDEVHKDGDVIVYAGVSPLGSELEQKFGTLPWLHWPEPFADILPAPDAF